MELLFNELLRIIMKFCCILKYDYKLKLEHEQKRFH